MADGRIGTGGTAVTVYHAFSSVVEGGSPAGLVLDAENLSDAQMQDIAAQLAAPATGFVTSLDEDTIHVRFFSPTTEYPMCGHGTIALACWLVDIGRVAADGRALNLVTLMSSGTLRITEGSKGQTDAMLKLDPSVSGAALLPDQDVFRTLGLQPETRDVSLPVEMTYSDFNSLIVPVQSRAVLEAYAPDWDRLGVASDALEAETIALICRDTVDPTCHIHMREFCPAVGTLESAATGTTNRALACYLAKHGVLSGQNAALETEQGFQMGRPSRISSQLVFEDSAVSHVWVGGTAVKAVERLILPSV